METVRLSDFDLHLLGEGSHYKSYEKLGSHLTEMDGVAGTHFAVWAPNAREVSVIGDFNEWNRAAHRMDARGSTGIWTCFIPGIGQGSLYKYVVTSRNGTSHVEKSDPYAFAFELRPHTASKVWDLGGYQWGDQEWMARRAGPNAFTAPISIYELHLGSWRRVPEEGNRWLTYRELAPTLAAYVQEMGFTHVELMPITEHPFDGSWGYQTIGYFAPTSRFGTPQDLMFLIDTLHQHGIGVLIDWVPAHFPRDAHGLGHFDGTHLYEYEDPRKGEHKDWGTLIFNYGRWEVANFLISSALFWLDKYHVDGLRVDAVASMLYLDYSRNAGEWTPNKFGGREHLEAIDFLRRLNEQAYGEYPGIMITAEESTAWPMVSRPTYLGGLGFGMKWDMGWMHDTLAYLARDAVHRKFHHNQLTFRMVYAFTENFILPLSHDEVVHGKKSLLARMPGDPWQQFANLRLLYGYMYTQPGKKLLFMGGEIGQWTEWNYEQSVEWHLLKDASHSGLQRFVRDLNTLYRGETALHQLEGDGAGFEWVDCNDTGQSVLSFLRKGMTATDILLVICNFTPVPRNNYRVGVPFAGRWEERLNSDARLYGGSGQGNLGEVVTAPIPWHGCSASLILTLPPLSLVILKYRAEEISQTLSAAVQPATRHTSARQRIP